MNTKFDHLKENVFCTSCNKTTRHKVEKLENETKVYICPVCKSMKQKVKGLKVQAS